MLKSVISNDSVNLSFATPTQVEVCVNNQTIKTHKGGGGVEVRFNYTDEVACRSLSAQKRDKSSKTLKRIIALMSVING